SHHGLPEFGAIKPPSTPEALAVHIIENMDAKLMMALSSTRGENGNGEGNWTEYMKAFSGKLYRPDVAPADVGEGEPLEPSDGNSDKAIPTLEVRINNPLFESTPPQKK
ncbi:MAG TPA: hypothetical protein VH518_05425, partial [Tepidisphaeraceae bacterium]